MEVPLLTVEGDLFNNTEIVKFNSTFLSTSEDDLYQVPVHIVVLLSICYGTISVLAVLGNALVIWIIVTSRTMRNVTHYFIANLAFADILIGLFAIPFEAALLQRWSLPAFMCPFCPFVKVLSVNVSVLTLTAIAIDRHRAVLNPLSLIPSKLRAKLQICAIWVLSAALGAPMAAALRVILLEDFDSAGRPHYRPFCFNVHLSNRSMTIYQMILFAFQYAMPLLILSVAYARMALELWGSKAPGNAHTSRDQTITRNKKKVIKMLVMVVLMFAICWLPIQTYNVLQNVFPSINSYRYINIIWFCFDWLAMSNSCCNPFIYSIYNEKFKRELIERFPTCLERYRPRHRGSSRRHGSVELDSRLHDVHEWCRSYSSKGTWVQVPKKKGSKLQRKPTVPVAPHLVQSLSGSLETLFINEDSSTASASASPARHLCKKLTRHPLRLPECYEHEMERKRTDEPWRFATIIILLLTCILHLGVCEEYCGLGTGNDYSPWIANEYGRLAFPAYNQEVYGVTEGVDVQSICQETLQEQVIRGYDENKNKTCQFDLTTRKTVCKGKIKNSFVKALKFIQVSVFVVDSYRLSNAGPVYHTSQPYSSDIIIPDDTYKLTGDIFSQEIGIGMRTSVNLHPNANYNGFEVSGDAFSNDLRVGWRVEGDLKIYTVNETIILLTNLTTVPVDGGWSLIGNLTFLSPSNTSTSSSLWDLKGYLDADFLLTRLNFDARMTIKENRGWVAQGKAQVMPILIAWAVDATVTPSLSEQITIPRELFSHINITHMVFKDSYFMGDFDKDTFKNIIGLKTINFFDSKLEEVPRLDYLFRDLTELQAIYIEGTSMPNVAFGDYPSLLNLEFLSFKGSGPLQLDGDSFTWLSLSNLTYMNLQDCNIKINKNTEAVLSPVSKTLKYLDLSYTSLTDERSLSQILRTLSLTHLSMAGLQLSKVPVNALDHIKDTLKYLTLRGNNFRKVPEENMFSVILEFPNMPNLQELDLMRCGINLIEVGAFDMLPNLQKLFLSYNNVANIQEGWYNIKPGIRYLDLSWNGATEVLQPTSSFNIQKSDSLSQLKNLEIADFSNGLFENTDAFVASLQSPVLGISFCNMNLRNLSAIFQINYSQLVVLDVSNNPSIEYSNYDVLKFFHSLTSLKYLHAKNNKITNNMLAGIQEFAVTVKINFFMESVIYMDLSGNNLKSLTESTLRYFPNLEFIDLTANSITSWSAPILSFNPALKVLKISDNKIERITDAMEQDFYKLKELEVGKNPFVCDCFVEKFAERLLNNEDSMLCEPKNVTNVTSFRQGYFSMPRLRREKRESYSHVVGNLVRVQDILRNNPSRQCIASLFGDVAHGLKDKCVQILDWEDGQNYYCYNQEEKKGLVLFKNELLSDLCVAPVVENLTTKESANMSVIYIGMAVMVVLGLVVGIIYWKWWDIRLLTRAVRNAAVLAFMDKDENETQVPYQYCAFISYSDKDRPWVLEQLLPQLETWNNLKVCLHERDFQVGTSILENITSCMDRSKNIVLILSKAYLKSQWCQFEMHLAQHRLIETKRDHLILILLEQIPAYKTPKTLKFLLRTKTYIQWPVNLTSNEQDRFWSRLFQALSSSTGSLMPV